MAVIATESLSKTYRRFRGRPVEALRPLDLAVDSGEIFGLLGPNGAGKTTLLKLLLGIARPSSGHGWLLGRPVSDPASRSSVGYLPENHRFPGYLTARQALDHYGRLAGVSRAERLERGAELLERVGLARWADTPVRKYSKGMMQRLGLVQALLNRPELLFLDEPTDGVDPVGRREIRDLLVALRNDGVTIFLNSHMLGEVEQVCSRVAILHHGELLLEGPVETLTSRERAWELRSTTIPPEIERALDEHLSRPSTTAYDEAAQLSIYHVAAEDRAALNAVLDRLRRSGVEIEAITPLRQSLEDAFVEAIEQQRRGA